MDKKTLNTLGTVIFLISFALQVVFSFPRFLGISMYSIMSPDMEPVIHVGSLAYAVQATSEDLAVDDMVVYRIDGESHTRRILSVDEQAKTAVVNGDANTEDKARTVAFDVIKGKIVLVVPFVGKLGMFANKLSGKILLIGMMFAGARMIFFTDDGEKKNAPPPGKKIFTAND